MILVSLYLRPDVSTCDSAHIHDERRPPSERAHVPAGFFATWQLSARQKVGRADVATCSAAKKRSQNSCGAAHIACRRSNHQAQSVQELSPSGTSGSEPLLQLLSNGGGGVYSSALQSLLLLNSTPRFRNSSVNCWFVPSVLLNLLAECFSFASQDFFVMSSILLDVLHQCFFFVFSFHTLPSAPSLLCYEPWEALL